LLLTQFGDGDQVRQLICGIATNLFYFAYDPKLFTYLKEAWLVLIMCISLMSYTRYHDQTFILGFSLIYLLVLKTLFHFVYPKFKGLFCSKLHFITFIELQQMILLALINNNFHFHGTLQGHHHQLNWLVY
jgi:hypothetical protein